MRRRPAALLLDLDGVLVDTETPALAALTTTFHDFGVPLDQAVVARRFRGVNLDHCPQRLARLLGRTAPAAFVPETRRRARRGPAPRAEGGARQLLTTVGDRRPWRIVTNSALPQALATLEHAGLGDVARAADVLTADRVHRPKPAPDLYLAAAAELGVDPADCLAVEDSLTGLRAARAAGVPAVAYAPDDEARRELLEAGFPAITELTVLLGEVGEGGPT